MPTTPTARQPLVGLLLVAGMLAAAPAWAARRVLTARDLGSFEGEDTIGTALNDQGQIVGVTGSGVNLSAFLMDGVGIVNLGPFAAIDINNSGQILLQTVAGNPDDPTSCYLRQPNGTMVAVDAPAGSQCFAADLNERGQVVGSVQRLVGTQRVTNGFLWDAGVYTDLGTLGGDFVMANAVNDLGQIAGSATLSSGYARAFFWDHGVMTDLGSPGGLQSEGRAINNRGQVAFASGAHVYLWETGTLTDLGTMGGPDVPQQASVPLDLNERGQMLVAVYDIPAAHFHWGIWSAGRWVALPGLGSGVPTANRLNERGQAIGSDRTPADPRSHMVLWRPEVVRGRRR